MMPIIWIMHTVDGRFYIIEPTPLCHPQDHGRLNDHVIKITEALTGEVLWERTEQ